MNRNICNGSVGVDVIVIHTIFTINLCNSLIKSIYKFKLQLNPARHVFSTSNSKGFYENSPKFSAMIVSLPKFEKSYVRLDFGC